MVGLTLWWSLVRPVARAVVTRVVLGAVVLGGLARLLSAVVGWPAPGFVVALAVEVLVVPLLLVWHLAAVGRSGRS